MDIGTRVIVHSSFPNMPVHKGTYMGKVEYEQDTLVYPHEKVMLDSGIEVCTHAHRITIDE